MVLPNMLLLYTEIGMFPMPKYFAVCSYILSFHASHILLLKYLFLLHDQLWICSFVKLTSKKAYKAFCVHTSQLIHCCICHIVSNRLWYHHQNINCKWDTQLICEDVIFIFINEFGIPYEKQIVICALVMKCLYTHLSVIVVFISLVTSKLWEINTKISLSWVHE